MAETSKNKIYYNDNENSVADVLTDMEKMAESTDEAIEKSKYNDAAIKKSISDVEKKQVEKNTEQDSKIVELQTEKAKLETELKEMQEDFYQNSIRGQASGEYIHVEDSSNCRAKIGIGGNHEQETREGYNLLNNNLKSQTINGVTVTVNDDKSITFNGKATAYTLLEILKTTDAPIKLKKGTYTISYKNKPSGLNLIGTENSVDTPYFTSSSTTQTLVKTYNEDITITRVVTAIASGTVFNNLKVYLMIYSETGEKPYEQYGAMPSSDYPSPIKAVGDNVNIFDKDNYIKSKLYINKNENKFSEASMGKSFIFDISKYNKLTISKVSSERFGVFASVDYPQKDGVGTYLQDAATNATSFSYDFAKFNYLVVFYYFSRDTLTEQEILDSIKIVEGTETGEYSRFGQGCVKVTKCNKNLANIEKFNIAGGTGTTYPKTIQGLKENTAYTISFYKSRIVGATISNTAIHGCRQMHFYHNEEKLSEYTYNSPVSGFSSGNKKFEIKITTPAKCNKVICYFDNANGDNNINTTVYDIQLEEGTTTSYEEHQEQSYIMPIQQPMRSIGDIRDTFIKKENKWYERHYVQRLILNGTEGWNYDKNNNRFYFAKAGNKGSGYIMSSHYLRGDTTKQNNTCEIWSSAILFRDERFTEREDFKNMIKAKYNEGIPVYVDYVSITPTDIECTEEQSQILEELNNARTYKNVTNITTDSKAILSLDYAKDLETLLNNTQALAVNNASEGV